MGKIAIIGIGKVGSAIAYTLLLKSKEKIILHEPKRKYYKKAYAEYLDLKPIGKDRLKFTEKIPRADKYIITSGIPRKNIYQSKISLFGANKKIISSFINKIPKNKTIFIVTNPAKELAKHFNAISLRDCTDKLRGRNKKKINEYVLREKGYTQYTPGYACAMEAIKW